MSDEKPFAVVSEDDGIVRIAGIDVSFGVRYADAAAINAAVAAERRDAVVAKLRELSRTARGLTLANGGYAASEWLAKEADAVERGE